MGRRFYETPLPYHPLSGLVRDPGRMTDHGQIQIITIRTPTGFIQDKTRSRETMELRKTMRAHASAALGAAACAALSVAGARRPFVTGGAA